MPWSGSKSGVPEYAVIGGFDGGLLYFARSLIDGGIHVGRYSTSWDDVKISYNDREWTSSDFEVSFNF